MVRPRLFVAVYPAGVVVLVTQAGVRMSVVNFYQLWLLTQSLSKPLRSIVVYNVSTLKFTFKPGAVYADYIKKKKTYWHTNMQNI